MIEETNVPQARPIEVKTIIKASSCGSPHLMTTNENLNRLVLGFVHGTAVSVSSATVEDRDTGVEKTVKALKGSFEAIPADPTKAIIRSSKLGLPEHIIAEIVLYLEKNKKDGVLVDLAFELGVERAKNPAGYSWFARPLMPEASDDPLAARRSELLARIAGNSTPQLAAPVENNADAKPESNETPSPAAPTEGKNGKAGAKAS